MIEKKIKTFLDKNFPKGLNNKQFDSISYIENIIKIENYFKFKFSSSEMSTIMNFNKKKMQNLIKKKIENK